MESTKLKFCLNVTEIITVSSKQDWRARKEKEEIDRANSRNRSGTTEQMILPKGREPDEENTTGMPFRCS